MENNMNAYSNVKSCKCKKEFCDYSLLVVVSRLGNEPDISIEMSCNRNLLEANLEQVEMGGWASGMVYDSSELRTPNHCGDRMILESSETSPSTSWWECEHCGHTIDR